MGRGLNRCFLKKAPKRPHGLNWGHLAESYFGYCGREIDRGWVGATVKGAPLASSLNSDTAARHDGHLSWGQEVWSCIRSQKELVRSSHTPPSSGPYPTFWIPLEGTVCKGALNPREGKVTGAGHTWEQWCARRWGWDEPVSRREAGYGLLFFFF